MAQSELVTNSIPDTTAKWSTKY